jgi:oligosaccharide repeat unit polymerase
MFDDLNAISAWPAFGLVALLAWAVFVDIRVDLCRIVSGRNVVILAIGAWYLLEAIMRPDVLRTYDQGQYNFGILCVGLAFLAFLMGYHWTSGCSLFASLGGQITFFDDAKWLWRLVLIGATIGFAPVVYFTGTQVAEMFEGIMGMRSTWGGLLGRGRYGDARTAFLMLQMFIGGVAPFAAILLFGRGSTLVQRVVCLVVLGWPILRAYGSGTRSSMITTFGTFFAVLYWKATPSLRRKLIIIAAISTPMLYGLMAALVISRGSGAFDWEDRTKATYVGNEMFREMLFIAAKFPNEVPYQYGFVYYVQLVNPIPRFLWPGKPTLDSGLFMADLYGAVGPGGEAFLTISPGLIGEMYMNFGVLGIIGLSFFGGWLVKGWDLIQIQHAHSLPAIVYYSGGLGILFIMGRSFTMNMFYGLLSLALLAWLIRFFNPHDVNAAKSTKAIANTTTEH